MTLHLALREYLVRVAKPQSPDPERDRLPELRSVARPGSSAKQLHQRDFEDLLKTFRDVHKAMKRMLRSAGEIVLPALKNLPAGQPLRAFLLEKDLLNGLSRYEHRLNERWIVKLLGQFNEMKAKVDRIHFKSLAGILALQEKIGGECLKLNWSNLPTVSPVPPR